MDDVCQYGSTLASISNHTVDEEVNTYLIRIDEASDVGRFIEKSLVVAIQAAKSLYSCRPKCLPSVSE